MKTSLSAVALAVVLAFSSIGCVSQRQYDELDQAYRKSQEQVAELQARIDELNQRIKMLEADPADHAKRMSELLKERDTLLAQLRELQDRYEQLAAKSGPTVLPTALNEELKRFAAEHPDLVEFDETTGMIKFRSDLTFALGSADLTAKARATLGQLAGILNGPIASKYEVRVVGHTDAMPISRAETRAKHPTNWHLSVHRAISVRDALDQSGVAPVRTSVGGYSMFRPVVQNKAGGAEPNRRVEIYLVPMAAVREELLPTARESRPAPAPRPAAAPLPATPKNEIPLK